MQMAEVPGTALAKSQRAVRSILAQGLKVTEALRRATETESEEQYALLLGAAELLAVELQASIAEQRGKDAVLGLSQDDDDEPLEPFDLVDDRVAPELLEERPLSLEEDDDR